MKKQGVDSNLATAVFEAIEAEPRRGTIKSKAQIFQDRAFGALD